MLEELRDTRTPTFKMHLLSGVFKNSIYGINYIVDVRHLSKLPLQFSRLNEHRFRHNFDCLDPVCLCGIANEDREHFLLHCSFLKKREEISLAAYRIFLRWI